MKKLFLLDGMALVYRAHFALIARPIFTSKGVNTSALYGFTQTLLDILKNQQPTHLAVAFDTEAPTQRHREYAEYKIQREAMPEDLSQALPHVRRMLEAFRIPVLTCDGYEADDLIGTLVKRAEKEGFTSYMVTPDKDFAQLVSAHTFLYKPSRMGDAVEILGVPEVLQKWGIQRPEQVIDILGLWGDTSDNIPGVPGIGEKTAAKLISQYGSIENLLKHVGELKGKLKEALQTHREQALLSKRLATICCDCPCEVELESLRVQEPNNEQLKRLLIEFEFNSIGRRLFGEEFKAGRGFEPPAPTPPPAKKAADLLALDAPSEPAAPPSEVRPVAPNLKSLADVPHQYVCCTSPKDRAELIDRLRKAGAFAVASEAGGSDPKQAPLLGLAFSCSPHEGFFVPFPQSEADAATLLEEFRPLLEDDRIEKVGHDLKFTLSVLRWHGVSVQGKLFDVMLVHSLVEPALRHSLEFLSESFLGYTPLPLAKLLAEKSPGQLNLGAVSPHELTDHAAEAADLAWQLKGSLEPLLREKGQERVYYEIEAPLIPALVEMEFHGIRIDTVALGEFAEQLKKEMAALEKRIHQLAGREFNLNSPKQLGEILFDVLKIADQPKKTKTGQYATNEQTLLALAPEHEIVQRLLEYRACSKLKSTYTDTLPAAVFPKTGRIHTTFNQAITATGRLQSENPNLQNIPIRSEHGREIRKAFVPRDEDHLLLSADYSQIELRIIAALCRETTMLEAFATGTDIHTATAAKVFGVPLSQVTDEMRRKAKMVNYGIAYGISAFGLSQRLGIPRKEGTAIIEQYFQQFPGIQKYMVDTIAFCRKSGYVETVTGRRRYIRDIQSSNATVRSAAERNAINAPVQGTAADMIKIAMHRIHRTLIDGKFRSRMLLQVHDELLFDLYKPEAEQLPPIIEEIMRTALPLDVPIVVEIGTGRNWLEAH